MRSPNHWQVPMQELQLQPDPKRTYLSTILSSLRLPRSRRHPGLALRRWRLAEVVPLAASVAVADSPAFRQVVAVCRLELAEVA
jgi:hypothetical protein